MKNKIDANGLVNNDKPYYRLLTGIDNQDFCKRVSIAIRDGYELYKSPAITFNGKDNIVAQALIFKDGN